MRLTQRGLRIVALVCCATLFVASTGWAQTGTWQLAEGSAQFAADYTFGSFRGNTTAMSGMVRGTSVVLARGSVEVRMDSLTTGNGLRDKHMREALETEAHPVARFTADSIRVLSTTTADSAQIFGSFTVRGVTRAVIARARVRFDTATRTESGAGMGTVPRNAPHTATQAWIVDAVFPVSLAEYGITKGISRLLGTVRVGPVVTVSISARFSAASASAPAEASAGAHGTASTAGSAPSLQRREPE